MIQNAQLNDRLLYGEEVIYETRPHWSVLLPGWALIVLAFTNWLFLIPAILLIPFNFYQFFSKNYIVTNHRLIQKEGLYYIRFTEWSYDKIDDVIYTQSIGERLWQRGSVILLGMAISKTKLEGINKPKQLRNVIQSQLPVEINS